MKPFSAPLDDILFSLNAIAGAGRIADWDAELAGEMASHFSSFAEVEIAPLDEPGDAQGCKITDGRVQMPDGFAAVYRAYCAMGWPGLTAPEEFGGQGLGAAMLALTSEVFSGACHSLQMVTGLAPGAIRTLLHHGTEEQKARFIPTLVSGDVLATMCLTEPGAGSDLSRIRCKAKQVDDIWQITGEKIFISGGDQNISKSILHLVLARTGDNGVRGLSLFLCGSEKPDGMRNDISVTRIEEKMGLHASPTCQLAFDGAVGELIGKPGDGLKAMFTMMNHARLDVALQGVAHATRATDIAKSYAAERVQGRGPDGATVTLDQHGDVRRMLDEMDSLALGARAMAHLALVMIETAENPELVEFLTPVAKVFCTEAGMQAANLGIQVLGGYGYLSEYRVEQTYRDARITAIYEGANGIHALALATRLLSGRGGAASEAFATFIADEDGSPELSECFELWQQARQHLVAETDPALMANDFLNLTAEVLLQLIWGRFRTAADQSHDASRLTRLAARRIPLGVLSAKMYAARVTE